jgi:hypothetical protein
MLAIIGKVAASITYPELGTTCFYLHVLDMFWMVRIFQYNQLVCYLVQNVI